MEEWKYCAQWLVDCQVIPPTHKVIWEDSQAFDLAQTLRDGVLLCQLLNKLYPGAIDMKEIALRPQMSQFLCLKNIRTFIQTCIEKFGLRRQELFDPYQLFDVSDFGKVIAALSKLSHTPHARSKAPSFPPANHYHQRATDDDIYKTLEELADERDLADEDPDDLYDTVYHDVEDDEIYGELCDIKQQLSQPPTPLQKASPADQRRGYCIREIVETEGNFVEALGMIIKNFIKPLKVCISPQDMDIIFLNIEKLHDTHKRFHARLKDEVDRNNSHNLSKIFKDMKDDLLIYGNYCAKLCGAQDHIDEISKNPEIAAKIDDCQMKANEGKFRLRDLLSVPMQRILKYHLLLRELERHTDKNHEDKKGIQEALAIMQDISMYVNEVKRDSETLQTITEIQQTVTEYIGDDLKCYGRLLKDGEMKLKSHEKAADMKTRYVFLFDKAMLICKTRGPDCYVYKDRIDLGKFGIEDNLPPGKAGRWKFCWNFTPKEITSGSAVTCFVKTVDQKRKWTENITMAKENIDPKHKTRHKYEYTTFDKPVHCSICSKLLSGIFFQGYKCSKCQICVHKQCLQNEADCKATGLRTGADHPPPVPDRRPHQNQSNRSSTINDPKIKQRWIPHRVSSPAVFSGIPSANLAALGAPSFGFQNPSNIQVFIATYNYAGIPAPPEGKVPLMFAPNDHIEVRDKTNTHWWEGRNVRTSAIGVFPGTYVKRKTQTYETTTLNHEPRSPNSPITPTTPGHRNSWSTGMSSLQEQPSLEEYPWFAGDHNRDWAELKLEKCPNSSFLVRESVKTGGYVLSIKHNNMPKHIKIRDSSDKKKYFLADSKMCDSIQDLVEFYSTNSLSPSFPGVDTTLQHPFKEAMRSAVVQRTATFHGQKIYETIGVAVALYDFAARDTRELTLHSGDRVNILSKAGGHRGWWKGQIDSRTGYFPSTYVEEVDG
ncbi:proto-oncogene vav-like isoform X4 [Ptychodera flava]|uniref:proto-oncogene vav-like isoform X4 n=1 Tax=Ptychodera flava TaxID=63121 RepID=UPI003969EFFC